MTARILVAGLGVAASLCGATRVHAGPLQAGSPVKVFVGPQGEAVTIVPLEPASSRDFLIKFDGFEGDWNGHVLLHHRTGYGRSEEYTTKGKDGWTSVTQRDGDLSARPHGVRDSVNVSYAKDASANVRPADLIKQFEIEEPQRVAQAKKDAAENQ